jgi:hypothetical protein
VLSDRERETIGAMRGAEVAVAFGIDETIRQLEQQRAMGS